MYLSMKWNILKIEEIHGIKQVSQEVQLRRQSNFHQYSVPIIINIFSKFVNHSLVSVKSVKKIKDELCICTITRTTEECQHIMVGKECQEFHQDTGSCLCRILISLQGLVFWSYLLIPMSCSLPVLMDDDTRRGSTNHKWLSPQIIRLNLTQPKLGQKLSVSWELARVIHGWAIWTDIFAQTL